MQHQAQKPASEVISPKVTAAAVGSGVALIVVGALSGITPELLAPLGAWEPVVTGAVVAMIGVLSAWAKGDPRRQ